jgi:nucleoside-diphosphate-sugar epimerase
MDLVTGASGFLGRRLTEMLSDGGRRVRLLAREGSRLDALAAGDLDIVRCSFADADALARAMGGVRTVYNCAGHSSDWGRWSDFRAANIDNVAALLEAALRSGSVERFVHVSTTDIYGYPVQPCDETFGFRDVGLPYNRSKGMGDELALAFHRERGLPVTVVRPATIFGPRSKDWVIELGRLLIAGRALTVDHGRTAAGLVYVDDVVHAMTGLAASAAAAGEAYNVVDPTEITWRAYVDAVADALGARRPRLNVPAPAAFAIGRACEAAYRLLGAASRPLFTRHVVLLLARTQQYDTSKLRAAMNGFPVVGAMQGLSRTAEWLNSAEGVRFLKGTT